MFLNREQSVNEIRPSSILCSVFRLLVPSDKRLRFSHMLGLGDQCVKKSNVHYLFIIYLSLLGFKRVFYAK